MNKTKIIVTVGPHNYSEEMLEKVIKAGADVIRFNMGYVDNDFCKMVILMVDKLNKKLGTYVSTMMDLEGTCIRSGKFIGGKATFKRKDKIRIYAENFLGDMTHFSVNYPGFINDLKYQTIIKLNEGLVEMQVIEKGMDYVVCEVIKGGTVNDNSKIYIPNLSLNKNFVTEKDKETILFANKIGVDFLGVSNVSNSEDILEVNDLLIELGNNHIGLLAKIENKNAVLDMDNIINVADGVILMRNDVSVEIPMEKVPSVTHKMVTKCQEQGKLAIVSAEFTSFKASSTIPNRAEVSDVANMVISGIDAIILTTETAIGMHPVEAIKGMEKIIKAAEENINYEYFFDKSLKTENKNITNTVSSSVVLGARELDCKAIIVTTNTGYTAKRISRFRPSCPIVAAAQDLNTVKSLTLHFGIMPILVDENEFELIAEKSKQIVKDVLELQSGDKIIITGGFPFKKIKYTNFMKIDEI